jgi:hypothetical protein
MDNASNREKLLKATQDLNIPLPKGKYIKNDVLKRLIIEYVNRKKTIQRPNTNKSIKKRSPLNLTAKLKKCNQNQSNSRISRSLKHNKYKIDIKKSLFPKVRKLVAIGDIHGDLPAAIKALKLAGVIDQSIPNNLKDINKIKWTGEKTVVVQLGDQIDRVRPGKLVNDLCPANDSELVADEGSDLKIICLFEKLHAEAAKVGGALFSIFGNHELMNVDGDFRYVSPKEFKEFGNFFKESPTLSQAQKVPYGYITRKEVFKPGGTLAKKLAHSRYSIIQVGSWLFVHGGITAQMASEYTIDDVNRHIKDWLVGHNDIETLSHANNIYHRDDDENSPFWSRTFSDCQDWDELKSTKHFYQTLNVLNKKNNRQLNTAIKGMIVGHSPQFMYGKGLNSTCNNKLWRVDVGMSRAFGELNNNDRETQNRRVQVLEITNDNEFRILE